MGIKQHPLYKCWASMFERCSNVNHPKYPIYGGRGIGVCDRWKNFSNFIEDLGDKPSKAHSIDRIDPDKGYSPDNCRWATVKEQNRNKRTNVLFTVDGETRTLGEWAELYEINYISLHSRIRRGWDFEKALKAPINRPMPSVRRKKY